MINFTDQRLAGLHLQPTKFAKLIENQKQTPKKIKKKRKQGINNCQGKDQASGSQTTLRVANAGPVKASTFMG